MGSKLVSIPQLVLYFFVTVLLPMTQCDLVADTCKSSPLRTVCISVLRSDPRSAKADVSGLAIIVVDAIERKSLSVLEEIKKLMHTKPSLKPALNNCAVEFGKYMKILIGSTKEALHSGNPKFAQEGIRGCKEMPRDCDEEFAPSKSPLTASSHAVYELTVVGEGIIQLLF